MTSKAICFPHRKTTLIGVFRSNGRPSARSHLRSLTVAPPEPPRSTPNPQTTTNMLSLIPKMGKRPAGCAKRPLFPAESGNKLISNPGLEVLRRGYGEVTAKLATCEREWAPGRVKAKAGSGASRHPRQRAATPYCGGARAVLGSQHVGPPSERGKALVAFVAAASRRLVLR